MAACFFKLALALLVMGAQEGRIKRINFEGNHAFRDSRLAKVIHSARRDVYSPGDASKDSLALVLFYQNQGFSGVEVNYEYVAERGGLVYTIKEGERLGIEKIRIIGSSARETPILLSLIPLKEHSPLTWIAFTETSLRVERYYKDRGYPYVVVDVDTSVAGTSVELTLSVVPGPRIWIAAVRFQGVQGVVDSAFLLRTTRLEEGELYSEERLDKASRFLYATSLFTMVETKLTPLASGSKDSLDVVFDLAMDSVHSILLGGGIATAENGFIPDRLLLSVGWEHLNLFHRGVTLSSELRFNPQLSGNYDLRADIRNRYPQLLPGALSLSLYPYWELQRRDTFQFVFYTNILGGEAGLDKDISDQLRVGLSMQVKAVLERGSYGVDTSQSEFTNFLRTSALYDNRNEFFNPKSGVFLFPYIDWAGRPFGGSNHFLRLYADFRNYLLLPWGAVFAWRLGGGWIIPHSESTAGDITYTEKFTLGGMGSVRALGERSVGPDANPLDSDERYGTFLILHSLEIRTPYAFGLLGLALFLDAGLCARDPNSIDEYWGWGPGIGIRVMTPIGPLRLDYAKNPKTPFSFDSKRGDPGRIELGFLQAF